MCPSSPSLKAEPFISPNYINHKSFINILHKKRELIPWGKTFFDQLIDTTEKNMVLINSNVQFVCYRFIYASRSNTNDPGFYLIFSFVTFFILTQYSRTPSGIRKNNQCRQHCFYYILFGLFNKIIGVS